MSKVAKTVRKLPAASAKHLEHLGKLRLACEKSYGNAFVEGKSGPALAFAGCGRRDNDGLGAIAKDLCNGPGVYSLVGASASDKRKLANGFAFRCDLVGLHVSFEGNDAIVRRATSDEKAEAIRNAARYTGRAFSTVAAISGFVAQARLPSPRKPAKADVAVAVESDVA